MVIDMEFIEYSKCSTCKKAKKFLTENNIEFIDRDIKSNNPTYDEIKNWIEKYNLDIDKLFNTSGLLYKELNLKEKRKNLSLDEKIELLSSNGMLVKRPILILDNKILIGFKEKDWESII